MLPFNSHAFKMASNALKISGILDENNHRILLYIFEALFYDEASAFTDTARNSGMFSSRAFISHVMRGFLPYFRPNLLLLSFMKKLPRSMMITSDIYLIYMKFSRNVYFEPDRRW